VKGTTYHHLTIVNAGTKTLGGATILNGDLTITSGTLELSSLGFDVAGTTSVTGTLSDNNITGTNVFTGLVTINSGGVWTTTNDPAFSFAGGFTVDTGATFTSGAGVYTFADGAAQTIGGTLASWSITNLTNNDQTSTGLTFSGAQPTITTLTQGTNAILTFSGTVPTITTLTATASPNTVQYTSGSAQTVKGTTYHHLTKSGVGTATLGGNITVNGDLTISAGALELDAYNLTDVTGSTSITGTLSDGNAGSSHTFSGAVTMNNGSTWNMTTGDPAFAFENGLTVDSTSTFTGGSGTYTFQTNAQTLGGTQAITITDVQNDITTSTGLTIEDSGSTITTLTQGASAILTFPGTVPTVTSLDARTNTPNTVQYTGASQNAVLADGTDWSQVGNDLNITSDVDPALAALSSSRVAFIDDGNTDLRTYDFDGTDWSQVGNDLNIPSITDPAITALSSTQIAFIDETNDDLRTYEFDGTDWSQVGNDLNLGAVGNPAISSLSSTRIALIDFTNDELRTYDFDGTDWSQVGNGLTIASNIPALAALSGNRVAFFEYDNDNLSTYEFDGTNWSQVGNDLTISGVGGKSALAGLSSNKVAFIDETNQDLRTYEFDGTDWSQVGNDLVVTSGTRPALAALSSTQVAFIDETNDDLRTYQFNSGYHNLITNVSGTTTLSGGISVNNDLIISSGTLSTGNYDIYIGGNYSNSGTFTAGTGTVTFDAGDTGNTLTGTLSGTSAFNNLTFNNSAGAWTLGAITTDVGGNLTVTSGALTAPSTTLTISGNFTNTPGTAASFVHNSGAVVFDDNSQSSSITGSTTFYDLTVSHTLNGDGKELIFSSGDTFTIDTSGTLTLTASGHNTKIHLDSDTGRDQWFIYHKGGESIAFVDLDNAGCDALSDDITMDTGSKDGSNNDSDCWIFITRNRGGGGGDIEAPAAPDADVGGGGSGGGSDTEGGGGADPDTGGGGSGGGGDDLGWNLLRSIFFAYGEVFESSILASVLHYIF